MELYDPRDEPYDNGFHDGLLQAKYGYRLPPLREATKVRLSAMKDGTKMYPLLADEAADRGWTQQEADAYNIALKSPLSTNQGSESYNNGLLAGIAAGVEMDDDILDAAVASIHRQQDLYKVYEFEYS